MSQVSMLEPAPAAMDADEADELCEEYLCAICQQLVLDPYTVCPDEHVFCRACLRKWLDTKEECPTCRTPAVGAPHRLRIINNAVEKLALRVLDAATLAARKERRASAHAADAMQQAGPLYVCLMCLPSMSSLCVACRRRHAAGCPPEP